MTRALTTPVADALAAESVVLLGFIELDFASGFLRLTSAPFPVTWNSQTWVGAGALLTISTPKEIAGTQAEGFSVTISGIPTAYVTTALTEVYQGRAARFWFAPLDVDSHAILADPVLLINGRMDNMLLELGEEASIAVNVETRMLDLDRVKIRRYTDADQQARYSGDLGLEFVNELQNKQLVWGQLLK
jgi:hypothetical protein